VKRIETLGLGATTGSSSLPDKVPTERTCMMGLARHHSRPSVVSLAWIDTLYKMRSVRTNQEAACTGGKLFRQINEILNKATSILYFYCRLYIGLHSRALSRPTYPCKYGPYYIVVFHSFNVISIQGCCVQTCGG